MYEQDQRPTYVKTGRVMLSFPRLFEPYASDATKPKKFSVCIIIPKSDAKTIKAIKAAIEAAKQEGKAKKFGGKIPVPCKSPLRDGDTEKDLELYPEFEDSYFINCSSNNQPSVVDADREKAHKDDVYGGNLARVSINFYAFVQEGNKGIAAGLNNVQILAPGKPLGAGKTSAADEFDDDFEDEEQNDPAPVRKATGKAKPKRLTPGEQEELEEQEALEAIRAARAKAKGKGAKTARQLAEEEDLY